MDMFSRLRFLFAKYLQRQCSPDEMEELIILLQQVESEEALREEMQLLWEESRKNTLQHHVDWDTMYSSIVSSGEHTDTIIRDATYRPRWPYYVIAAISLLVILVPLYWFLSHRPVKKNMVTVPALVTSDSSVSNVRQTIYLPDGSKVILNTASRLNYPSVFSITSRDTHLSGEGFFDIKPVAGSPFNVHTGKIIIKVTGAAFNIKAYPRDENIEVTVTRGRVAVLKEDKMLANITEGQQVSFVNQSEEVVARQVDTLSVISWRPVEIFYNDITMEDAVTRLEQRFNINIDFANAAVKKCRISAMFSEDDLPEEILAVICSASGSVYKTNGDNIIINGHGCKNQ